MDDMIGCQWWSNHPVFPWTRYVCTTFAS